MQESQARHHVLQDLTMFFKILASTALAMAESYQIQPYMKELSALQLVRSLRPLAKR